MENQSFGFIILLYYLYKGIFLPLDCFIAPVRVANFLLVACMFQHAGLQTSGITYADMSHALLFLSSI